MLDDLHLGYEVGEVDQFLLRIAPGDDHVLHRRFGLQRLDHFLDQRFAQMLRKSGKPVIVVANKAESSAGDAGVLDAWSLGLGEPTRRNERTSE